MGRSKSVSRLSETIDIIGEMRGSEILKPDIIMVGLLAEIAKSLAVIADKMDGEKQGRK